MLQLENVTTALRRNRQASGQSNNLQAQQAGAAGWEQTAAEILVVHDSKNSHQQDLPQTKQQQQQQKVNRDKVSGALGRPATPDTTELQRHQETVSKQPQQATSNGGRSSNGSKLTDEKYRTSSDAKPASAACPSSSRLSFCMSSGSHCGTSNKGLTRQQLLGLQLLVAAGTCHREMSTALVAAGVQSSSHFEWGQQLRYYWQADEEQLQV